MVIVQLAGGLGNQMFQYAVGRCLANRRSEDLLLHLSRVASLSAGGQPSSNERTYGLDVFNINARVTTVAELQRDRANIIWTITESGFGFFPEVLEDSLHHPHIGLIGWWQSEKYFMEIADEIRNEFTFKSNYEPRHDPSLIDLILSSESVCLHIRRTDYLNIADTKGFLGLEYYGKALDLLKERLNPFHLFVFSDDITWCREQIRFPFPTTFVSPWEARRYHDADDLRLMTMCKHFIIANSTYSWWGAWLANSPTKLVIAPRRWFHGEGSSGESESYLSSADLIPEVWIRL